MSADALAPSIWSSPIARRPLLAVIDLKEKRREEILSGGKNDGLSSSDDASVMLLLIVVGIGVAFLAAKLRL